MAQYNITLNETQVLALSYTTISNQEWIENVVVEQCRKATDDIVQKTVAKCLETGTQIPTTKEEIVSLAFTNGWVKSAADRQAEFDENSL